ncbi:cleavage and polyadenylation specificity factor subunit 2 [Marchantia polymorpha subsp. ruderalis]|uniref:Cleavage and polyadenylation specificity factor subunit 2 n=2 Tax=Marchantia polymorpha TaxID=3197 RepID=A0AAF6AWG0_MARPO|nr:hypothetical protein MARPO_0007s0176 [Marchantia polymorpha]BBN04094.1 hypothetical protein Mp_3g01860 [Marchantia polymorpha subsp. ruderalis]|eukprot:PTQ47780.1 hypothetical protein MARPO_0007s0176 [Marchantia polymorpha]
MGGENMAEEEESKGGGMGSSSVQITPLSGAHSESPLCYLLEVDGFRFLLDCGWTDAFDVAQLQPLASVASTIDAVLLSYPDTMHLGALPYAVGNLGLTATVYCTLPVHRMGQMYMYDHYLSRRAVSNFDLFNLDDVDTAFGNSVQLKYSQHHLLQGKGEGITITPYAAGRLLGGTVWKITVDTEDIIYAVDFNHRKERHLNGTVLQSFVRPAVLITDSYNALNNQPLQKQRDAEFLDVVMKALRAGGNVLLPVETAGRVLELVLYLDKCWAGDKLNYPMALLTNVSYSTLEFAKSLLEWMSDAIAKSFEHTRDNSFVLKYLKLCHTRKDLDDLPAGPKVVFASMASLEAGFARELFVEWATDPNNLVLFTERGQVGTLSRKLQAEPPPKVVKVTLSKKVPLTGEELKAHEEQNRSKQEALKASVPVEETGSQLSGGSGPAPAVTVEPVKASEGTNKFTSGASQRDVLIEGFTMPPNSVAPMFPFHERASDWDEYGEIINPDDYISKVEDMMDYTLTQQGPTAEGEEKADGENEDLILNEKPSKVVLEDITVQVRCSLHYMDYEGRSDGKSIKNILAHVAPLKLVLVHGSAEATEHLRQHCQKNFCQFVYAPRLSETVDITSDLSAYKVRLTEQLMSNVLFRKLGDYELAWVDGEVGAEEDDMLPLLPAATPPPHKAVYVGDLWLADFKQLLATKGVQAEFAGGLLRCGENIAVRKSGGQQLVIEGPLSEDYYRIRELLYSQFYML